MAIVTILAIETDIHGYRDRTGLETDMAIVTALVIETDMAIVTVLASKPTFIFPELNRVSNARNSFEGSLRGTVHISLINAEVAKTVTSLLRCICSSLAQNTLPRCDHSSRS